MPKYSVGSVDAGNPEDLMGEGDGLAKFMQ
jgi:hypothetical protein